MKTRKELAIDYVNRIRTSNVEDLALALDSEVGIELGDFLLGYAINLINKDPNKVMENCSALMLLGYMIRVEEEKATLVDTFTQTPGLA